MGASDRGGVGVAQRGGANYLPQVEYEFRGIMDMIRPRG